jgi:hypothetical protein
MPSWGQRCPILREMATHSPMELDSQVEPSWPRQLGLWVTTKASTLSLRLSSSGLGMYLDLWDMNSADSRSGAKGVLTCWPKIVGDHEIRLRPSMVKFESKLQDINVVRVSQVCLRVSTVLMLERSPNTREHSSTGNSSISCAPMVFLNICLSTSSSRVSTRS